MKITKIILSVFSFLVLALGVLYAQEVTVLYTGQTHAMLYPCSCPIQQDGGIARRGSLIKELRKKYPGLLLLDCGNFTAGGLLDEYTQGAQLDLRRSEINFKSLELMQYDAVGIGSDEFNFGRDFFLKNVKKSGPAYLSANLEADGVIPYLLKDVQKVKVGIIGLTNLSARQKADGLKIGEIKEAGKLVKKLKKEGAQIIIVLSTLGEQADLKLISDVKGIDVLFVGQDFLKEEALSKVDSTFILRPAWQGRKLGKLTLKVKNGLLADCKLEELRLSSEIADDGDISTILPRCYSDSNCKKDGLLGSCQDPGTPKASCLFKEINKVDLLAISAKDCSVCGTSQVINSLKKKFPGITARYLYYPDAEAQEKIKGLPISGLPIYILSKEIEKDDRFSSVKNDFLPIDGGYLLKPQAGGLAFLLNREEKKGSLDLFFSLFEKDSASMLAVVREFKPSLHFLAVENNGGFSAKGGPAEVEEYLRGVCVQKYYPQKFWDYSICRAKTIGSSYWEDCLGKEGDFLKIKSCARGPEGLKLLKQNTGLVKELQIGSGPVYLLNNREIFSSRGVPKKEDLEKIIKK